MRIRACSALLLALVATLLLFFWIILRMETVAGEYGSASRLLQLKEIRASTATLRVASYNIWNYMFHWDVRAVAISDMIRESAIGTSMLSA